MQQKSSLSTLIGWLLTLSGAIGCFVFFQCFYPYHLQHREQTMLFLCNADYIAQQYPIGQRGFLARLIGDFLQQFFYYLGAGPAIVSLLLTLIGVAAYKSIRGFWGSSRSVILAYVAAMVLMLWEGSRECLPEYPLAATVQVLGWLLLCWQSTLPKTPEGKLALSVPCILAGGVLFNLGGLENTQLYGKPDMTLEHQLALDVEASYGHWDKVEELTQENLPYNIDIYYHNLAKAMKNQLPQGLLERYQNGADGLFMPVNENGNFFLFAAAGEAWWAVGDMTMAEHATMLGMIFSPRHTSSRCLRRLAEINLAKGDRRAAMKYLRMLQQSIPHRAWAEARIAEKVKPMHQMEVQSTADTLRLSTQNQRSLRNLLESHPNNLRAHHYLLCLDLLLKDMLSFAEDIDHYGAVSGARIYEEAMLIVMASRPEMRDKWHNYVNDATFNDFQAYNALFEQSGGNKQTMRARFGQTYWYFMHFEK